MDREQVRHQLVVVITGDRGLAGAYNMNVVRYALDSFRDSSVPVSYVIVGRKGRDLVSRMRVDIRGEFNNLPAEPKFSDVSAIGRLLVDEYLQGRTDQVHVVYTRFVNLLRQVPTSKKLLPLEVDGRQRIDVRAAGRGAAAASYIYEPGEAELIEEIVPRFTALQIYQAILESLASEHAARMVAMQNATENANTLRDTLRLDYNKARQQAITSEILDIVGGAEALGG
jgi:F-type H+-transporting ATPase subunit gamma